MDEESTLPSDPKTGTTESEGDSSTESKVQAQEENQTQGQQTENSTSEAEKEESFFDASQVPEELKGAYKQMQAAFTKKTQALAEERKQAEEWRAKAESYSKYDKYAPILEEMLASESKSTNQVSAEMAVLEERLRKEGYTDEAIQMMKIGVQFTMNQFQQKEEEKERIVKTAEENRILESKITEAGNIDPRLEDKSLVYQMENGEKVDFGTIVAQLVVADSKWQQDPVSSTKRAIKIVDALIGQAKNEGKNELSSLAKSKAQKFPSTTSSPQKAIPSGQPQTMREAAELAKQELGIT